MVKEGGQPPRKRAGEIVERIEKGVEEQMGSQPDSSLPGKRMSRSEIETLVNDTLDRELARSEKPSPPGPLSRSRKRGKI